MTKATADKKSQLDRFKEAAEALETDDSEERFDERLKRIAKSSPRERSPSDKP